MSGFREEKKMAEYKYTAFISYRHLEPDSIVAEKLHKMLETYTIPKNLQKTLGRKKIGKVFRDKEELPLTDSLDDQLQGALEQSEFLIVICSPRLKESKWCAKEIETFVEKRGKKNVLLVLADGEPDTSFPKIIYDKSSEPLAADARGTSTSQRVKKLKVESLRLLAPILGVGFDDLKQREKERRIKKAMTVVSAAAAISFAFAALAILAALKIQGQANSLAYDKALQMASESERLLTEDKRLEALQVAYEALTSSDNVDMPYTPEAQYSLTEALRVYDSAQYSKAVLEINATDTICAIDFNSNPFEVIYADKSGNVAVWLYREYNKIYETTDGMRDPESEHIVGFIDSDTFYYINKNKEITIASTNSSNGNIAVLNDAEFKSAHINEAHNMLAALSDDSIFVYNLNDYSVVYSDSTELTEDGSSTEAFADSIGWDEANNRILYSVYSTDDSGREKLKVADIDNNELMIDALFAESEMKDCVQKDGVFYVLSGRKDGDLGKFFVCAIDADGGIAKWNSTFNGTAGELFLTSCNTLAVTAGNDLYIYNCDDGNLIGNYSFDSNVGCISESDGTLYVRNLNGDSSVIDSMTGAYVYLGKLIDCTNLNKIKALEITEYNYAYMGVAANGNDNHLIFYNYMVNDHATPSNEETFVADYEVLFGNEAIDKAKQIGADVQNTVYSVVSDKANVSVVSYKNGLVAVCDNKDGKVLSERDIDFAIDKYFGEDVYGNRYFGNDSRAIMISPANEVIASIEDMQGLTLDCSGILMNSFDEERHPVLLKYEVYTTEELLEQAEFKMEYYNCK